MTNRASLRPHAGHQCYKFAGCHTFLLVDREMTEVTSQKLVFAVEGRQGFM